MDVYPDFTSNPLPHNATLHWTPVAAPFFLPWWTSVIGGIIGLVIAINNYVSVYRRKVVYEPPPAGSQRFNVLTKGGRHFTLALFGLCYTSLQNACGLLHIALEHSNISHIQHVNGGSFVNLLASIGTVHNPTIRTIPALSLFAVTNACLSILHFTLLTFLPKLGTAPFWQISSGACIADVCDATSPYCQFKAGPNSGLFGSIISAASCVNSNTTALGWGESYGGEPVVKLYTLFFIIAMAVVLVIMILGEVYLYRKGDFAPTTFENYPSTPAYHGIQQAVPADEESKSTPNANLRPVMKINVWYTFSGIPMLFGIVVCVVLAAITWYHGYKINHTTLQLIVTICPTVKAFTETRVPQEALGACTSVGFVHGMTETIGEAIKARGFAIFLRLVYNI